MKEDVPQQYEEDKEVPEEYLPLVEVGLGLGFEEQVENV